MIVPRAATGFVAAAIALTILSIIESGGTIPILIRLLAASAFIAGAFLNRGTDDNTIAMLATGELLVIAVAQSSFIAGFLVQCAVIGAALFGGRGPAVRRDIAFYVLFCLVTLGGAIVLDRSNQILLPFLAIVAVVCIGTLVTTAIAEVRERRKYAGGGA